MTPLPALLRRSADAWLGLLVLAVSSAGDLCGLMALVMALAWWWRVMWPLQRRQTVVVVVVGSDWDEVA